MVTVETPNRAASSATRARPCSSTMRAMWSWRSRAKTSPGALVGTRGQGRLPGICGNGWVSIAEHYRRVIAMSRTILKSFETCGTLSDTPPGRPTHRRLDRRLTAHHRHLLRRDARRQPSRPPASDRRDGDRTTDRPRATEATVTSASRHRAGIGRCGSSCRRGRSATPGRGSRSSPSRASRATRTRRSTTRPRSTATPASRRRSRSTSRGTRSTTTRDLARHAASCGVALGTINSNTFQDDDYMLGSVCHPDPRVRRKAIDHLLECVDIMDATGSRDLKLWFADGTNYPGQDDIRGPPGSARRGPRRRSTTGSATTSGWSSSTSSSSRRSTRWTCPTGGPPSPTACALGEKAKVVVDTGHHAPGTNIEFIVASCCARASSARSTSTRGSTPTTT